MKNKLLNAITVALILFNAVAPIGALAYTSTDQADYAPGSVVTIFGDNSDGAGYLDGEPVHVAVSGPNGYTATCDGFAVDNGAWSCQVTLWDSSDAVGAYSYIATGQTSGVTQNGTFTDATNINSFASDCSTPSDSFTSGTTVCAKATGLAGGGGGSSGKIEWWAPGAGSATRTTTFSGVSGNTADTFAPAVCGTWTLKVYSPASTFQDDDTFSVTGCVTNNAPTVTANDQAFDEGALTSYSASWSDPDAGQSHTCTIDFGDGSGPQTGTVSPAQPSTSGTCSLSHTYADGPNSYTITVNVSDGTASGSDTAMATVNNVDPTGTADNANVAADEGNTANNSGTYFDPGDDAVTLSASVGTVLDAGSSIWNWSFGTTDGPDESQTVTIYGDDGDGGGPVAIANFGLTVNNVAPTVTLSGGNDLSVNEGSTHTYSFLIFDPGVDTITGVTVNCGANGTQVGTASFTNISGSFDCKFPDGPAMSSVSASATDSDGGTGAADTQDVIVNNVAPVATLNGNNTANEGDTKTYSFTVNDPGDDTYTGAASCGTGGSLVGGSYSITGNSGSQSGSFQCSFPDGPATPTVTIQFTDSDGDAGNTASVAVTVNNVKPTPMITSLSGNSGAACIGGNTVTLGFSWTDPAGANDTYRYDVNWGDGTPNTTGNNATSPVSGLTHTYAVGGPYTISVTVNDEDAGAGNTANSSAFSFLYNTSGILQPINLTGPRSSFKIGSTIPVKIKVTDCNGTAVSGLTLTVHLALQDPTAVDVNELVSTSAADSGTTMRFTGAPDNQYIFNLSTKRSQFSAGQDLTTGTYHIWITGVGIAQVDAYFDARK